MRSRYEIESETEGEYDPDYRGYGRTVEPANAVFFRLILEVLLDIRGQNEKNKTN